MQGTRHARKELVALARFSTLLFTSGELHVTIFPTNEWIFATVGVMRRRDSLVSLRIFLFFCVLSLRHSDSHLPTLTVEDARQHRHLKGRRNYAIARCFVDVRRDLDTNLPDVAVL